MPLEHRLFRHCEQSEAIQISDIHWIASDYHPRNDVYEWFYVEPYTKVFA